MYVKEQIGYWKLDDQSSKVNSTSAQFFSDVETILKWYYEQGDSILGIVLYSGKVDNFFAGADLKMLNALGKEAATLITHGEFEI